MGPPFNFSSPAPERADAATETRNISRKDANLGVLCALAGVNPMFEYSS